MTFVTDRSDITDKYAERYYFEQAAKTRADYEDNPDRIALLTDQVTMLGNELGCIADGIEAAFKHYSLHDTENIEIIAKIRELGLKLKDTTGTIDINDFRPVLRLGRTIAYRSKFKANEDMAKMPIFVSGVYMPFEDVMRMMDEMRLMLNTIGELVLAFEQEETKLAA